MLFDRKTVIVIIVCLSMTVFVGGLYEYHRKQSNSAELLTPSRISSEPGRFTHPSLKFVAVLFRHGDRAPTFGYKTDPHVKAFPEGKGELTKLGKQHMYKKGQIFRQLYNNFISDTYSSSEISIKTTPLSRTYMSAAMVLAGAYPPKDYQKWSDFETVWQPIPIFSDSPDHGNLLPYRFLQLIDERKKCPSFDFAFGEFLKKSNSHYEKNETKELLSYLTEKCETSITEMNMFRLYDLFKCQIAHGLQLPEWLTNHHFQSLKSMIVNMTTTGSIYTNPKIQKTVIGPLIKEIAFNMESFSNNFDAQISKLHVYLGHDISLVTTMGFLGHIIDLPDFGASMHFHLYQDEANGSTVKIILFKSWKDENGEEVPILNCNSPCKFQDFLKLVTDKFSKPWEEECQDMDIYKL